MSTAIIRYIEDPIISEAAEEISFAEKWVKNNFNWEENFILAVFLLCNKKTPAIENFAKDYNYIIKENPSLGNRGNYLDNAKEFGKTVGKLPNIFQNDRLILLSGKNDPRWAVIALWDYHRNSTFNTYFLGVQE